MGHNLARQGHAVAVHNRSPQRTHALISQYGHKGEFVPA
jgi:6-phosphogluconate dehydrogenase